MMIEEITIITKRKSAWILANSESFVWGKDWQSLERTIPEARKQNAKR
ncbi:MAG: hypothetical protein H5T41_03115 [Methanomassiliicoccales archaeon]|nr:hypothetical protein [Methanomassiliicoccales archaeon]